MWGQISCFKANNMSKADKFRNAMAHALGMEIDGDILKSLGKTDMVKYVTECRDILKTEYQIVPFPFEDDFYPAFAA